MKFLLESLPTTVILETFSYIEPDDLLDLSFLNKNFFNILRSIIQKHLQYSGYHNPYVSGDIQSRFIKSNSSIIKHLRIDLSEVDISEFNLTLNIAYENFKDLKCLFFTSSINDFLDFNDKNFSGIKKVLFNLENVKFELCFNDNVDRFLLLLNPKKLNSLTIFSLGNRLIIDKILRFKEFIMLEELKLSAGRLEIESDHSIEYNTNIFPALKILEIEVNSKLEGEFNLFGNTDRLKTITFNLPKCNINSAINFIKNRSSLARVRFKYNSTFTFFYSFRALFSYMNPILELINEINILFIGMCFLSWNDICTDIDMPIFNYVEEIKFLHCEIGISLLSKMLQYFPNIKKIRFESCTIDYEDSVTLLLPNNSNSVFICIDGISLLSYKNMAAFNGANLYLVL